MAERLGYSIHQGIAITLSAIRMILFLKNKMPFLPGYSIKFLSAG